MQKKRPCSECRSWFLPNPRVGDRQRTCGSRLYLRAKQAQEVDKKTETNPGNKLLNELGILGAVAWRAQKQLHEGLDFETNYKRTELDRAWRSAKPPSISRAEKAEPYRQDIVELFERCRRNLVRVHEELVEQGAQLSYQALTAYCLSPLNSRR